MGFIAVLGTQEGPLGTLHFDSRGENCGADAAGVGGVAEEGADEVGAIGGLLMGVGAGKLVAPFGHARAENGGRRSGRFSRRIKMAEVRAVITGIWDLI